VPEFLSPLCSDIMKKILNTDPEKRITIEDIRAHDWFDKYMKDHIPSKGLIIGYNRIPVRKRVIKAQKD
jgi:5'-AMP-activated protein kinase catalytic alpha subunit